MPGFGRFGNCGGGELRSQSEENVVLESIGDSSLLQDDVGRGRRTSSRCRTVLGARPFRNLTSGSALRVDHARRFGGADMNWDLGPIEWPAVEFQQFGDHDGKPHKTI